MIAFRIAIVLGAVLLPASEAALAQQGQTVTDQKQQAPNRAAIPEKMGAPLEAKKANPPEEKAAPANEGGQLPENQQLKMESPVPNTGGTSAVPPSQPKAQ